MEKRVLGRSGIEVSRMGLGCATFGREIDETTCFRIMDYAVEHGITLFDTAESYGAAQAKEYRRQQLGVNYVREAGSEAHSSEKIIGRWLRARRCRQKIIVCTKVTTNFTRQHVDEALNRNLERLQTGFVDVYLFHSFDPQTPEEESLAAIDAVVKSGRARAAGCSNYNAKQLQQALASSERLGLARFEAAEPIYNLAKRDAENGLLALCRRQQIGVISYSPLGAGFLTGKYTPDRSAFPAGSRFHVIPGHADAYFNDRNFQLVERLHAVAERVGVPAVRLAMAWVLQNPDITTVLVGARCTAHLDNALAAMATEFPEPWKTEICRW